MIKKISLVFFSGLMSLPVLANQLPQQEIAFEDVSDLLNFVRPVPGFFPTEPPISNSANLAGAAWLDYDNDNDLDLFVPNIPGQPNALFRNDNGTFTNVAERAGLSGGLGGTGSLAGDYNNDGCVDLFVSGDGSIAGPRDLISPNALYKNQCDGTFIEVIQEAGIDSLFPAGTAAFGDIDNDGFLDLFVTNFGSFVTGLEPPFLYHNNGDGTFMDISASSGVNTAFGSCVVLFTDTNNDKKQDIVVGNCNNLDFSNGAPGSPIPGPWELWVNNGDLTFTNQADEAGLNSRAGFPMSLSSGDYDNDGDLDLFATGFGVLFSPAPGEDLTVEQVLFSNNGDGTYTDVTYDAGLGGFEFGWGAEFTDLDNDGDQDIVSVGSLPPFGVIGPGFANPGSIFNNQGNQTFERTLTLGLEFENSSGLAVGDFSGDGFVDVVMMTSAIDEAHLGQAYLFKNQGNHNRSITVKLKGTKSNIGGVGSLIHVFSSPYRRQIKQVHAGSSFYSTSSPWQTFGLGKSKKAFIKVDWPSGLSEWFPPVKVKSSASTITLVEGTGWRARSH